MLYRLKSLLRYLFWAKHVTAFRFTFKPVHDKTYSNTQGE